MKKTYIIPEMETVKLDSIQLLLETSVVDTEITRDEIGSRELDGLLDW